MLNKYRKHFLRPVISLVRMVHQLEVRKATLALRSMHLEHSSSLSPNTVNRLGQNNKSNLDSLIEEEDKRARTNVQHRFVKLFFYYLFFSFGLIELKPFVFGRGKPWGKNAEKV